MKCLLSGYSLSFLWIGVLIITVSCTMAGGNYSGGNKSGIACEKTIATIGYIPPLPYLFKQRNNTTQFLTYSNKEINKGTTHHNSSPIPTKKKTESFFVGKGEELWCRSFV